MVNNAHGLFQNSRPGKTLDIAGHEVEIPILYFRDDLFMLFFEADYQRVRDIMPSQRLYPVRLGRNKAIIVIAAFNYINTTIGPYGEVAVTTPVTCGDKPAPRYLPALMESRYPGFGLLVLHLPVTNELARLGGREIWGYTKFVADMKFTLTPEFMEIRLSERESHILSMRCAKRGLLTRDNKPIITYSVKNGHVLKTVIPQRGVCGFALGARGSWLSLGNHPMAESIKNLDLSPKPFAVRYYLDRAAILPEGRPIEKASSPLDGISNDLKDGKHTVEYI
jgi:hypothetical protein